MASLISTSEKAIITGIFGNIFDTFSRNIIVVKEPLRIPIVPAPSHNLFGFGAQQADDTFIYSGVSGIFPAAIHYPIGPSQDAPLTEEINAFTFQGPISIKVRQDARDFINTNKTIHIIVDGRTFFLDSDENQNASFDGRYFIFNLRVTK